jgi:hypothetical protein
MRSSRDRFIPQMEMEGGGGLSSFFDNAPPPSQINDFLEPRAPMNPNSGIPDETGYTVDPSVGNVALLPEIGGLPMNPNDGIADETGFNFSPPEGLFTPTSGQPPSEPAYTPPEVPDYFAQQFGGGETAGGGYGGYSPEQDDRYYEQMFAKGGLIDLLRRR